MTLPIIDTISLLMGIGLGILIGLGISLLKKFKKKKQPSFPKINEWLENANQGLVMTNENLLNISNTFKQLEN